MTILINSIDNYRDEFKGSKRAVFDVELSCGIVICGVMLHQSASGKRWVAFPSKEFFKPDGSKRFVNLFRFSNGARERLEYEILTALGLAEQRLV